MWETSSKEKIREFETKGSFGMSIHLVCLALNPFHGFVLIGTR